MPQRASVIDISGTLWIGVPFTMLIVPLSPLRVWPCHGEGYATVADAVYSGGVAFTATKVQRFINCLRWYSQRFWRGFVRLNHPDICSGDHFISAFPEQAFAMVNFDPVSTVLPFRHSVGSVISINSFVIASARLRWTSREIVEGLRFSAVATHECSFWLTNQLVSPRAQTVQVSYSPLTLMGFYAASIP